MHHPPAGPAPGGLHRRKQDGAAGGHGGRERAGDCGARDADGRTGEEPAAEAAEEAAEPEPTKIPEIQGDPTFEGLETEDEVTVDLGETQDVGGL